MRRAYWVRVRGFNGGLLEAPCRVGGFADFAVFPEAGGKRCRHACCGRTGNRGGMSLPHDRRLLTQACGAHGERRRAMPLGSLAVLTCRPGTACVPRDASRASKSHTRENTCRYRMYEPDLVALPGHVFVAGEDDHPTPGPSIRTVAFTLPALLPRARLPPRPHPFAPARAGAPARCGSRSPARALPAPPPRRSCRRPRHLPARDR